MIENTVSSVSEYLGILETLKNIILPKHLVIF